MFKPICYWINFVVLNVWHNMQNLSEELWAEFLLLLLICFIGYYFHISDLVFWPVCKSEYIEEWVRPANTFIYWCFIFGTKVAKNNGMERFDFFTFLFHFITCYMPRLKKKIFIYLFFFVIFIFFVSVFKYIVTRRYIVKNIFS